MAAQKSPMRRWICFVRSLVVCDGGKNRWVWDVSSCCSIRPCVVGDALRRTASTAKTPNGLGFVDEDPRALLCTCLLRVAVGTSTAYHRVSD